jgi:hypothetical protein
VALREGRSRDGRYGAEMKMVSLYYKRGRLNSKKKKNYMMQTGMG